MLRSLARTRFQSAADALRHGAARALSSSAGQEVAASKGSNLRRFLLAAIPIGVIAAVAEQLAHKEASSPQGQQTADTEAPPGSATAAAASGSGADHPHGTATIQGGVTSHGVAIDPANPLHKMLPETDCEFCLETREALWGMMKGMKKAGSGGGGGGSGAPAAGAAGACATAAASPSDGMSSNAAH